MPGNVSLARLISDDWTSRALSNHNKHMMISDESKQRTNLTAHGIELAEVACVFDAPMVTLEDERDR